MIQGFKAVTLGSFRLGISGLALIGLVLMSAGLSGAPGFTGAQEKTPAGASPSSPQTPSPRSSVTPDPLLKLKSELVVLPVSVTDPWGRFVPGMKREQFEVYEENIPQDIRFFSTDDAPISIGVILDVSGSMKSKIARAREAVRRFTEWSNPQDEFFAIAFNNRVNLMADYTDGEVLSSYLLFLEAKGRTALYDAIYEGVSKLKQARFGKRVLLVVSDGQDNSSRYSYGSLSRLMKESDVQIYTIGTPDPTAYDDYFERLGISILQQISKLTGGRQFTVTEASILEPVCITIARELRQQYIIGYMSSNTTRDGQWRKVNVRVQGEMKFKLTDRSLRKLGSDGVPDDVVSKLEPLKNRTVKALQEEGFLEYLKTTVGEDILEYRQPILEHVQKEKSEKLNIHTKRGYYGPRAQP
jgi:Ca-activated chloride channel family protein